MESVLLHSHTSSIPHLTGMNLPEWKEHVEFHFEVLDHTEGGRELKQTRQDKAWQYSATTLCHTILETYIYKYEQIFS